MTLKKINTKKLLRIIVANQNLQFLNLNLKHFLSAL